MYLTINHQNHQFCGLIGAYTKTQQSHAIPISHGISWGWKSWEIPGLLGARGHREKFVAMSCVKLHTALGLCDPRDVGRYGRHGGSLDTEPGNCCVFLQARKWVIRCDKFEHVPHHELLIYIALSQSQLQGDEISIWKPLHFHLRDLCSLHPPRPFLSCLSPWGFPHAHPVRWSE